MLTSLKLSNFKAIKDLRLKNLKKLTIFIGQNNAGKSSILQSIALLSQSVENQIQYKGKMVDLGSFKETVYGHKTKLKMTIDVSVELGNKDTFNPSKRLKKTEEGVNLFGEVDLTVIIGVSGISGQEIRNPQKELELRFIRRFLESGLVEKIDLNGYPLEFRGQDVTHLLKFRLVRGRPRIARSEPVNFLEKINMTNRLLEEIKEKLNNIYYFSPMRAIKEWGQELRETDCFGSLGEDAISMLHQIYSNDRQAFHRIEKWIKDFGLGTLFSPIKGARASILLGDPKLGIKSNLVSQGFGANQLLSVIGQCFASPRGSTILIEEPEISLHPGAINILTDMFLEVISENKQILLSTHSDRLILELWARIKMGLVDKNDVGLYLIEKTESGVIETEIELDQRINEIKRELKSLYEPRSPLDELLEVADESGDKDLSKKDFSEL